MRNKQLIFVFVVLEGYGEEGWTLMMELGSPVTWTKLCNLFYVFFILIWFLFLYVSSTGIYKDSMFFKAF